MKRYSQSKHQQIQRMSSVRQRSCETRHSFRTLAERSEAFLTEHHAFGCHVAAGYIVIGFHFSVTPSYIKNYCQTLELTLVKISLFSRMPPAHRSRKTIAFLTAHVPDFIRQFRKRLSLVITANGGHIEHHFD